MKTADQIDSDNQTLVDHLVELRTRLIRSALFVFVASALCYGYSEELFNIIRAPIEPYLQGGGLVFTAPMDKFMAHIKIAILGGVVLSCPFWIYQVWKFVAPGLYSKEKNLTLGFILSGTFLFLLGVCFSYFVAFPLAFDFLMNFGGSVDKPMITIDAYLSFMTTTTLMFGVAFELPMVIIVLGMLGIVSQKFLREKRRYAVVILSVVAAILSPPDVMSMVLMMIPMLILYEVGVFAVGFFEKKRAESIE